jgi:hypothetical protein
VGRVTARRMDCTGPEDSLRGSGIVKVQLRSAINNRQVVTSTPDYREDMVKEDAPRAEDRGLSLLSSSPIVRAALRPRGHVSHASGITCQVIAHDAVCINGCLFALLITWSFLPSGFS